jgi:lysine biosynthesis protein LysW
MTSANCPDCNQKINLGQKPKKGQLLTCPFCNTDLEILSLSPLELDYALYDDYDDDWEDDDLDDEDDWEDDEFEDDDNWDDEDDDDWEDED